MGKKSLVKNFLTELYRNLTVEVLSSDNDSVLEFQALTDLCAENNVRIPNSIFANHEIARLEMAKQDEGISQKYNFFDDDDDDDHDDDDDNDKNFSDDVSIKQESDLPDDISIKQESDNEIDDRETIPYTSLKRENDNKIDEKIHKEPKLETAVEIEKKPSLMKKNLEKLSKMQTKLILKLLKSLI